MTVEKALIFSGSTKAEATEQLKRGTWLETVPEYIENYQNGAGMDQEQVDELKERIERATEKLVSRTEGCVDNSYTVFNDKNIIKIGNFCRHLKMSEIENLINDMIKSM